MIVVITDIRLYNLAIKILWISEFLNTRDKQLEASEQGYKYNKCCFMVNFGVDKNPGSNENSKIMSPHSHVG